MDGHDPHPVVALGRGRCLRLGVDLRPRGEEVEQPTQVATLALLVGPGQPRELAHVRQPRLAGGPQQGRQVVASLGHRRLDQPRQREPRRPRPQPHQAGRELGEQSALPGGDLRESLRCCNQAVALGRAARGSAARPSNCRSSSGAGGRPPTYVDPLLKRQRLQRGPHVSPSPRRGAQEPQRVRRDRAGGRGERPEERFVVERVGDRRQQRADVRHLLLGPVAASADHVGTQPRPRQRVLVGVEVGEGAQQDDHRAAIDARLVELAQARRQRPRLGQAVERRAAVDRRFQLDPRLVPAVARGEVQLDRRAGPPRGRGRGRRADPQRPVVAPEQRLAEEVDRTDHLRPRAEVAAEAHQLGARIGVDLLAAAAEDVEVGVAEGVDRLQFVADHDQLGARPLQRLDQPQLEPVGVLELVDQEVGEAAAVGLADLGPLEQARGEDLEILEVDPGAALLGGLEACGVEPEQLGEVVVGDAAAARLGDPRDRLVHRVAEGAERPGGAAGAERFQLGQGRQRPGRRQAGERLLQHQPFAVALLQLLEAFTRRLDRPRDALRRVADGWVGEGGLGDAAAAQLVVDGDGQPAQPFEVVCGDGLLARRVAAGEEAGEGGVERLTGGALGLGLVEHAEAGIDPGGDRMGGEDAVAEAVDGGDPGAADRRQQRRGADRGGVRPGGAAPSSARTRTRSSAAALSVKVKARTASGETPSSTTRRM